MIDRKEDIDWAEVIDLLAHEYGWTIEYIASLTMCQVNLLIQTITNRYQAQNRGLKGKGQSVSKSGKFQADDIEKQLGTIISWGAKKEIGPDGKERYKL